MENTFTYIVENVEAKRKLIELQATRPAATLHEWQKEPTIEPTPFALADAGQFAASQLLSWCSAMRMFATGVEHTPKKDNIDFQGTIGGMVDALEAQVRDAMQLFYILTEMTATGNDHVHVPPCRASSFDPALHYNLETIFARHAQQLGDALEAMNRKCEIIDVMRSPAFLEQCKLAMDRIAPEELSQVVAQWLVMGCPAVISIRQLADDFRKAQVGAKSNPEPGSLEDLADAERGI